MTAGAMISVKPKNNVVLVISKAVLGLVGWAPSLVEHLLKFHVLIARKDLRMLERELIKLLVHNHKKRINPILNLIFLLAFLNPLISNLLKKRRKKLKMMEKESEMLMEIIVYCYFLHHFPMNYYNSL